jgi:predicted methyltransferase
VRAAEKGTKMDDGSVLVRNSVGDLAALTGLDVPKVNEIIQKLAESKLVQPHEEGYIVPDTQKLLKFLEFLAMKEQFGDLS